MRKIHLLPKTVIAQIAAGEVIERPVFAVKELVENAIDAHADTIQILLENAGMKRITITDNGEGMSKEDLLESYKHHTTSKFSAAQNLIGIKTFGFRGEALSSICAISDVTIKSKTSNAVAGTMIKVKNGTLTETSPIGMPEGTQIIVENIFGNIPARKKFLKSGRTELRHCINVVLQISLVHPEIAISMTHNGRLLFDFPKSDETSMRVQQLFGLDIFSQMIPVADEQSPVSIRGSISKPQHVSSTTNKQYIFINNRLVTDRGISQTVKEAYGRLLDSSSYPLFVLSIKLPPEMVDVNVHPRKEYVSFINQSTLYNAIKKVIEKAVSESNMLYGALQWERMLLKNENMPAYATNLLRDESTSWDELNLGRIMRSSEIFQIHNLYLLTHTYNGILLLDQHAAHERVLYEQFIKMFQKHKKQKNPYSLKEALVLNLSLEQLDILREQKDKLKNVGFGFENFGQNAIKVTQVPRFFKDHNIHKLIIELCNNASGDNVKQSIDAQSEIMLRFLACRSAIKSGEKLNQKQRKELLEQLEKTPNNLTCPHGRPTKIELPLRQFHKIFKRT